MPSHRTWERATESGVGHWPLLGGGGLQEESRLGRSFPEEVWDLQLMEGNSSGGTSKDGGAWEETKAAAEGGTQERLQHRAMCQQLLLGYYCLQQLSQSHWGQGEPTSWLSPQADS